jgi:hypothetical protein
MKQNARARNFRDLESKMSPESRARVAARVKETLENISLDQLRAARELTQEHLQEVISKMERRTDMYIGTLPGSLKRCAANWKSAPFSGRIRAGSTRNSIYSSSLSATEDADVVRRGQRRGFTGTVFSRPFALSPRSACLAADCRVHRLAHLPRGHISELVAVPAAALPQQSE